MSVLTLAGEGYDDIVRPASLAERSGLTGRVLRFDTARKFGFISISAADGGGEVFFHIKEVSSMLTLLGLNIFGSHETVDISALCLLSSPIFYALLFERLTVERRLAKATLSSLTRASVGPMRCVL